MINSFPIDGLHPGGCRNADGYRLVPGTLNKGHSECPAEATSLDVDSKGVFVGRDSKGAPRCEGPLLVGATFTVEAWAQVEGGRWETRTTSILIAQARSIMGKPPAPGAPSPLYPAYLLTPEHDPAASLCDAADAMIWRNSWLASTTLKPPPPQATPTVTSSQGLTPVNPRSIDRYALLIPGSVFDQKGTQMPQTDPGRFSGTPGWFNIACTGGALAKMRIEGYEQPSSIAHRQATLKMLTARYCRGTGYTASGFAIKIVRSREPEPPEMFDSIEARWNENGAVCLSRSRLWRPPNTVIPISSKWSDVCRNNSNQPIPCPETTFVEDISGQCDPPLSLCERPRPEHGVMWTTYSIDHADEP